MEILVLVTPSFNMAATAGFLDPFRAANYLDGLQHFHWVFTSETGGDCLASNGMTVHTEPLANYRSASVDLVVVSSSWTPEQYNSKTLLGALRHWARRGVTLAGLDTGAFILAESGLLQGRSAAIHYEHVDAMIELYPNVETTEDLYVIDGNIMTCCGGVASIDLALQVVRSACGDQLANAAARYIFHPKLRPQGTHQIPKAMEPLGSAPPTIVRQAITVMEENLEETVSIAEICRQVRISQRQLDRLFAKYVKKAPAVYYRDIRLDRARGLVTQTDLPLSEVALASGFSSHVHFSRAYKTRFGLTPRSDRTEGRVPFEFRAWPAHRKKKD